MRVKYTKNIEEIHKDGRVKIKYNYVEMANMLAKGLAAICEDMTPQQAWYAKRRLTQILGEEVVALSYEVEDGRKGYIIMRKKDFMNEDNVS